MSKQSQELAAQETATEVALSEREAALAALAALRAQQDEEEADEPLMTPILKIGEPLTKEVQDANNPSQAGDFINSLTGEPIGKVIDFIVAYYQRGRFAVDRKTNRVYVAFGAIIPEGWKDLVGEQFVGTRFDQYPDAEEKYKVRANLPDGDPEKIDWGHGPLISTTYNYTGLAVVAVRDDEDQETDEVELQPVRLTLKRLNTKSHTKMQSLRKTFLREPKQYWDRVFQLATKPEQRPSGTSHIVIPSLGRATTDEEREAAMELAFAVAAGRTQDNQDKEAEAANAPVDKPKGALAV